MRSAWRAVGALSVLAWANVAQAQPTADQILADAGLPAEDKQRVLSGEFVTVSVPGVSDRDLSFAVAFLVKRSPEDLSRQTITGELITADSQVQAYGELTGEGSLSDFAKLSITSDEARALTNARPGDDLNLSRSEIAAFRALAGGTTQTVQRELQRMLLARYRAYRASGLAGIASYDRGDGKTADPAADLRKASEATQELKKYLPAFRNVLLDYPKASASGLQQNFFWLKSLIHGKTTYVLVHLLGAPDGAAQAGARREYYVSTGYNAEQSVAGFLPVQGGSTIVVSVSHAFTEQVTGFGGSMKRSIGSKVMAGKMEEIYQAERELAQKQK
jgi:hypothetical protein